jgi:hypothetical protein
MAPWLAARHILLWAILARTSLKWRDAVIERHSNRCRTLSSVAPIHLVSEAPLNLQRDDATR